jgi:PAS domain S-box-containing protein
MVKETEILATTIADMRQELATVNARRLAEERALDEVERSLHAIVNVVPDLIYRLSQDGTIVFINEAIRSYGYDPEGLVGTSIFDLIHPDDRAKARHRINERRTGGRGTKALELRIVAGDSSTVPFEFKSSSSIEPTLVVNAEGIYASSVPQAENFLFTQGIGRDVTERKRAELELRRTHDELETRVQQRTDELRRANQQLQDEILERERMEEQLLHAQKMEAVGQLTAGIAHNFNNMLQGVVGNLELAMEVAQGEVEIYIGDAIRSADRAVKMIQQLMLFSRRDPASFYAPVSIRALINNTVEICHRSFDRKIAIVVSTEEDLSVRGDLNQLEQVLLNLCINARDSLEESGQSVPRICIEATIPASDRRVEDRGGRSAEDYVCLRILDNGTGMDELTRNRIFEPFFTTKDVDKGTGLGLATTFEIVSRHEGWVECSSEVGAGTSFSVFLPRGECSPEGKTFEPIRLSPGGGETILLVDDEESVRSVTRRLLVRQGYTVLEAEDGETGLELLHTKEGEIDLVLLDLSMPGMSGAEVLEKLASSVSRTRVVILTGYPVRSHDFKNVSGVITKPFTQNVLFAEIRKALKTPDDQ